jgi:peptide/nickel transport system substrate-binding protein
VDRTLTGLPAWARHNPRRVLAAAAVLVLVVVLAVSCLGGTGGRADVPVVDGQHDQGLHGIRAASHESGGTLRLVSGRIDSLDPQRSYQPGTWNLMRLYTRTLVTYSSVPGKTDQLVPDLATDLGTTEDGGKTWTFTLREGVAFETGQPITSGDVKYGISRSFAPDVVVGGPTYVVDLLDDPANPYPGPYNRQEGDPELTSVSTPDAQTIVFHLRSPRLDFPYVLALPSSSPVPKDKDSGAAYGRDPVSSGPYAISSVDAKTGIVLDRNPKWDPQTDEVRTALPDQIVVRMGLAGVERDQALLAGSADVDISGTGVQSATTARLSDEDDDPLLDRVDDLTTRSMRLLAVPTTVKPFDNPACRAAVAAAVDRRAVQEGLGGASNAVRTSQLWPSGLAGGPDDRDPTPEPAAAREALQDCGQPDGFSTVLAVNDVDANVAVAHSIADELGQIGVQVEVKSIDTDAFYGSEISNPENVRKQGYGLLLATWTADFPTPGSFLAPLVDGRGIKPIGNTNYAALDDKGINELIDAARAADAKAALPAWQQVAAAALETHAYVPLATNRVQLLSGQRLHNGVVMLPYTGYDLATAGLR